MPLQSRRRFLCHSAALATAAIGAQAPGLAGVQNRTTARPALNAGRTPANTTIAAILEAGIIGRLREIICWSQQACDGTPNIDGETAFRKRGGQLLNGPFAALQLNSPATVFGAGATTPDSDFPQSLAIRYEFAAQRDRPGVVLTWYDGQWAPPYESVDGFPLSTSGALYLGHRGQILDNGDGGRRVLLLDGEQPRNLPCALTADDGPAPVSRRVELAVVAGLVSYRVRHSLEWDRVAMCYRDCRPADGLIRPRGETTVQV